ncbi:uncharacterized protein DMENIID0001_154050 [Sergentomyia squamirostris]
MRRECEVVSNVPEWLTHDYLCKVLLKDDNKDYKDWESQIIPFNKANENTATELFQIKLTNQKSPSKAINVMIKTLSENVSNSFGIPLHCQELMCKRESDIYIEFLSEVEKILTEIGDNEMFFPKFYHSSEQPVVLVLKDLSLKGYFLNIKKFTLKDSKKLLEKIAKMHALSYYMAENGRKDYRKFKILFSNPAEIVPIIHDAYDIFIECIETWPACQQFADKMKEFKPHYSKALNNLFVKMNNDKKFSVLVHGDIHIENVLYGSDDDIILIDYQMTSWLSPAFDLLCFFNGFCTIEDNVYHRDLLIKHYHEYFRLTLKKLDFKKYIPTLVDVHVELAKYGLLDLAYWTVYATTHFARSGAIPVKNIDIRELIRSGMQNPNFRIISRLFADFLEKGYLEIED